MPILSIEYSQLKHQREFVIIIEIIQGGQ